MKITKTSSSPSRCRWRFCSAGNTSLRLPQAERQRQAAQQQQSTQVNPNAPNPPASPSQAGGASPTVPGTVPSTPAAPTGRDPRGSARPLAARRHRHPCHRRLDQPARRPHRRRVAEELPRDRRSQEPEHRAALARRQPRTPITRSSAGSARRPARLPNPNTVWTADKTSLTPGSPVTLTWDNGQGLVFRRTISVDDKFMFTVKDAVENRGTAPVTLQSYGLVSRHGTPDTLGYYVLHEGMIGVLGDQGLQEYHLREPRQGRTPISGRQHGRQDLELASPAASSASPTSTGPLPSFPTRRSPTRAPSLRGRARRPRIYQANDRSARRRRFSPAPRPK